MKSAHFLTSVLVSATLAASGGEAASKNPDAPLGSADYIPTVERPVGWRGDGTGRYPAARPPTTWERKQGGADKNIQWAKPLPSGGVASPIIVGDKIFITGEIADLICLDKKTGRLLWIRSNPEFEGLTEEERKANPIFAEQLAPLVPALQQVNEAIVAAGANQQELDAKTKLKKDIEAKIDKIQVSIDKKKFDRYWARGSTDSAVRRRPVTGSMSSSSSPPAWSPATISTATGNGSTAVAAAAANTEIIPARCCAENAWWCGPLNCAATIPRPARWNSTIPARAKIPTAHRSA